MIKKSNMLKNEEAYFGRIFIAHPQFFDSFPGFWDFRDLKNFVASKSKIVNW